MDPQMKHQINASLKNLIFFAHQNLLIVIQILLNRMVSATSPSKKSTNYWASSLHTMISSKMVKKIKTKGEAIQTLKVHMQNSENIMRNIMKVQQAVGAKKRIFTMVGDWLNTITTITNEKIRETLYNIE